jgi:hypothetical protein
MATTSSIAIPKGASTDAATSFIFGNSCQCHYANMCAHSQTHKDRGGYNKGQECAG